MTTPDEPTTPAPTSPPAGPRGSEGLTTRPLVPAAPPSAVPPPVEPESVPEPAADPGPAPEPELDPAPSDPAPVIAADDPLPAQEPVAADPEEHLVFGDAPAPTAGRSRAWLPLTAVGLAVALLAGGTGALAWELRQQDRADAAAVDAVAAARDAARLLFSYDHKTLQADFDKGLAVTTGDFRAQYMRTTKDVVSPVAVQYKAVVKAEVVEAAVIDARADEVTALVFLNQATTSTRVQGQQVDQSRVRMRLVPRGGRWLVEEVKAL